jgi:uncharacterized protein YbjT (DUF2867 family)
MSTRTFLITGATGKQGGAVITALLGSPSIKKYNILALTRNASSTSALSLASKYPQITLVEGDITKLEPVFKEHKNIDSIFLVTVPPPMSKIPEEDQAYPLIDAALKNGVGHLVFTSVDRGGPGVSEKTPTTIAHFKNKHLIEEYLIGKSEGTAMAWTILRPVAFMDNLTPNFFGKVFASMWGSVGQKPLQLISVHDIGVFGAKALEEPEAYKGRAITLAGDELTLEQGKEVFKTVVGKDMPETWWFVGPFFMWLMKEVGTMFTWFRTDGFGANIAELKKEEPKLQDFATWLRDTSEFKKA